MSADALLLANLTSTLFLTGVAWVLQVVHFPLLRIDRAASSRARNTALMSGPMLIELLTSVWLLIALPAGRGLVFAAVLVAVIWITTFARIVPLHARLIRGRDQSTIGALLRWNWIRTAGWTVRSVIIIWIVARRLGI